VSKYEESLRRMYVNLEERWADEQRRRELTPAQVESGIASQIEQLKSRAC
jgi:hypothetical protein